MDHTARIALRGVDLTALVVMQLMAYVTLDVVQDGRETFVDRVSFLITEILHTIIKWLKYFHFFRMWQ